MQLIENLKLEDKWIISKLNKVIRDVTKYMDKYEFNNVGSQLYSFIWNDFCDTYIEFAKFSLDSNGNLVVNTITCNQINSESTNANPQINTSDICNLIYPVGSLYLTVQNVSPQNLFGGAHFYLKK